MKKLFTLILSFFIFGSTLCAESERIALVLSGGGAKGAYEVGVWKALEEYGLAYNVKLISGTSVGALNAALFACSDTETAEKIWREKVEYDSFLKPDTKNFADIWNHSVRQAQNEQGIRNQTENYYGFDDSISGETADFFTEFLDSLLLIADTGRNMVQGMADYVTDYATKISHSDGIFSREALEEIMENNISLNKIKNSGISVYAAAIEKDGAMVTNSISKLLGADNAHYFCLNEQVSDKNVKDILMASSSFPLLYSTTELSADVVENGEPLGVAAEFIDGGFDMVGGKNTPVKPAAYTSSITSIFVVYLKSEAEFAADSVSGKLSKGEFGDKKVVEFVPSEDLGNMVDGTINFSSENINHLIELGYEDAVKVLSEKGYKKPSKIKKIIKGFFN